MTVVSGDVRAHDVWAVTASKSTASHMTAIASHAHISAT